MKLAAQLYTIRDFTQTPENIDKSLKKIRDIGYKAIQVSGFGPIEPKALKEIIDKYGLEICATHTPIDRIINDTKNVIAEHKLYGCNYIGLGSMPKLSDCKKEDYDKFLKTISPAVEEIYNSGLKFLYHNHNHEFSRIDGKITGIEYLAEKTDPVKFGFLADFYWVQAGGASPTAFINKYAERLDVVHFKDMAITKGQLTMAEIFEGNMDYDSIYDSCLKNGVKWVAIEQDVCPADPFLSLKISFDNLIKKSYFKD